MTKKTKKAGGTRPERRISIRSVRHDDPDLRKIARALIAYAVAKAEADAEAEHQSQAAAGGSAATAPALEPEGNEDRDER